MTLDELMLLVVLNGATAVASFLTVLLRPARHGILVSMALGHFGVTALVILYLAVVASPAALFFAIGIIFCGVVGTLLGGGMGELVRQWRRRSRVGETITFRGSLEQFAAFERFYAQLATRKAEIDGLKDPTGVREAEAANSRWADLIDAATLNRLRQSDPHSLESLLGGIFAGTYTLGELSFHRGVGRLAYVPAKRSLGVETLPLKMVMEMFGLEIVSDE